MKQKRPENVFFPAANESVDPDRRRVPAAEFHLDSGL